MSTAQSSEAPPLNPLDQSEALESASTHMEEAHPQQPPLPEDSAVTKAKKVERHGGSEDDINERPTKRQRTEDLPNGSLDTRLGGRVKGVAPIKAEFLIDTTTAREARRGQPRDDEAEEQGKQDAKGDQGGNGKNKKKSQGQNTKRDFGFSQDAIKLCTSRVHSNEFDPVTCRFGASCKFEHDIRKYLRDGKRQDLDTFEGHCPVLNSYRTCRNGWKCRFVGSHSEERKLEGKDGTELVLLGEKTDDDTGKEEDDHANRDPNVVNVIPADRRIRLNRRKFPTPKSEPYTAWLNKMGKESEKPSRPSVNHESNGVDADEQESEGKQGNGVKQKDGVKPESGSQDQRETYFEPPFLPSEKRRIYYGPETPVLAPLTTQGNLPFRRLCVGLGAQITWSEMAMGLPLIQGDKSEWALMKAHTLETTPPKYQPKTPVFDYDNAKDLKFGAQIAGNKPWLALKATEILTSICPSLRAIDLNCGCPIDLVFRQGAGSALLDAPGRLIKILRGMHGVSGEVPITVKIRMGTRDNKPTAQNLVNRLAFGDADSRGYGLPPAGVSAVTLHGRSRQQRYTKSADWSYISECAAVVKSYNAERDTRTDTIREPDARTQANQRDPGRLYFIGNGDCYSHTDYNDHIANANVDSVMMARGALIKPWIFEEIASGQHLDKSASERLAYIETFCRNGLTTWGSDEIGIGTTRRFLLEWLSFACRYVPVGMLEHLPPNIQDRPPAFRGRNELETLLSSDNYKDWIKISEMFLGKPHDNFKFVPKHRSSSYETEAEG